MTNNDLGKNLVESSKKIQISDIIEKYQAHIKDLFIKSQLEMMGVDINLKTSITGNGGTRLWFECPLCKARSGILYQHPIKHSIGCRKCLNLEYRKTRFRGMIEADIR